jgi:hypothetical protein
MKEEDLLKCPLLQGLDAMHRAELLGLINASNLSEKMEQCLADHAKASPEEVPACVGSEPREFEKEVRNWNPQKLIFSRSPKE